MINKNPWVAGAAADRPAGHAREWRVSASVAMLFYLLWTATLIGLRSEHVLLAATYAGLFWVGPRAARFALYLTPLMLGGILYDNLRLVLTLRADVHVADLYFAELRLFGIETADGLVVPSTYLSERPNTVLDLLCGLAYFLYLVETFVCAFYLWLKDERRLLRFGWAFLATNLIGFTIYLAYPAAPPWYVDQDGLGPAVLEAAPSAAGAARFDALLGIEFFAGVYSRNANVFAAMPSLHVAYPTVVAIALWRMGLWQRIVSVGFAALVAFSAVYLNHHYILDLLAGVLVAAAAYGLVLQAIRLTRRREVSHAVVDGSAGR